MCVRARARACVCVCVCLCVDPRPIRGVQRSERERERERESAGEGERARTTGRTRAREGRERSSDVIMQPRHTDLQSMALENTLLGCAAPAALAADSLEASAPIPDPTLAWSCCQGVTSIFKPAAQENQQCRSLALCGKALHVPKRCEFTMICEQKMILLGEKKLFHLWSFVGPVTLS